MSFTSRFVRAVSAAAILVPLAAVLPGSAYAAPAFCSEQNSYFGATITWTGNAPGAHNHDWNDADNWAPSVVPDVGQDGSTYQDQYVCIGGGASVTIAGGDSYHVAGIDIGQGAQLVVGERGGIFTGAPKASDLVPSFVEKGGDLELDAATLGGNSTVQVSGTLDWKGVKDGVHRLPATQAGSGTTTIQAKGKLVVDGAKFGAAVLSDTRTIDNFGTFTIDKTGLVSMVDGTSLIDEKGSTLSLQSDGGIYPNQPAGDATIKQSGAVIRNGHNLSVIGLPTKIGKKVKPVVTKGGVVFDAAAVPAATLSRGTSYGIGSCVATDRELCHATSATKATPQDAVVTTSTAGPTKSKITVALSKAAKKIKGNKAIGRSIEVTAPTEKTTHSTLLTFNYDASMKGVGKVGQPVYRGKKKITVCAQQGLTATNTSCVHSQVMKGGDLEITVITIQPNATWTVA